MTTPVIRTTEEIDLIRRFLLAVLKRAEKRGAPQNTRAVVAWLDELAFGDLNEDGTLGQ